jgi:ubiquinone/menaquinone biosynthesis C-methylase UbiE/thiamine kinase-like enzyme
MDCRFCCPKCKSVVELKSTSYDCSNCNKSYLIHDRYADFLDGQVDLYPGEVPEANMKKLIQDIDSSGFAEGLRRLYVDYPHLREYIGSERRGDWICHCFGGRNNNNRRCLDIGSGLGNLSEMLSHYYDEVYSLEAVPERIEFQKRRFKNSNVSNVTVVRGNALELPFPDDYFDLVVCNGVLEWVGIMNTDRPPREVQLSFLREVKRVLSDKGCLYIGIENRFGRAANFLVKRYGRSGGMYRDTSKRENKKEWRVGYRTYNTYSIKGYNSLFREAGFKFKSYWAFPSYNKPLYSARLNDGVALKGAVKYIGSLIRFKTIFSIIEKFDSRILSLLANAITPSFLFYCYKNEIQESVDDIITDAAQLRSYFITGDGHNIRYLLYHKNGGTPSKVAQVRRYSNEIPQVIPFYNKEAPSAKQPQESIWFEEWLQGRRINPASLEEAMLAVEWLFDFQNKTKTTIMTQEDVSLEIAEIRRELLNLPMFNTLNIEKWLNDYYILSQKLNITKSAQHGDFFWGNILFDPKTKQLHVIDWEYYKENSNPLFDFIYFIITAMGLPYDSANGFRNNLSDNGLVGPTVLRALIARAKEHFGAEFDLNILMPYALLRYVSTTLLLYVSTKSLEQKQHQQKNNIIILHEELFENMAKLLRVLSSSQSTLSSSSLND